MQVLLTASFEVWQFGEVDHVPLVPIREIFEEREG